MIRIKQSGNFNKTENFLKKAAKRDYIIILDRYAKEGVNALASATPRDSGITADSWGYKIVNSPNGVKIIWTNSHIVDGATIAILIQYGHGTKNGGYVEGRDYINPAIKPIFDKIAQDVWREVMSQ